MRWLCDQNAVPFGSHLKWLGFMVFHFTECSLEFEFLYAYNIQIIYRYPPVNEQLDAKITRLKIGEIIQKSYQKSPVTYVTFQGSNYSFAAEVAICIGLGNAA